MRTEKLVIYHCLGDQLYPQHPGSGALGGSVRRVCDLMSSVRTLLQDPVCEGELLVQQETRDVRHHH